MECESRFAVLNANEGSLKGAEVVMKLATLEIGRPGSRKVGVFLLSGRHSDREGDDEGEQITSLHSDRSPEGSRLSDDSRWFELDTGSRRTERQPTPWAGKASGYHL